MWKYPLNRMKYLIYSVTTRILKGGDIVDREKHKLKAEFEPSEFTSNSSELSKVSE